MKKVVLSLAVLFTVALVSCSGNKNEATDSDSIVADTEVVAEDSNATVDSPVVDSPVVDSPAAEVVK